MWIDLRLLRELHITSLTDLFIECVTFAFSFFDPLIQIHKTFSISNWKMNNILILESNGKNVNVPTLFPLPI